VIDKQYVEVIADLAKKFPRRIAATVDDEEISYADLDRRSNQMARVYQSHGAQLDDIITLSMANSIKLLVAMLACWKVGARPNPISSSMPVPELLMLLKNAKPRLVLRDGDDELGFPQLPASYQPSSEVSANPVPILPEPAGERALASGGSTGQPKLIIPMGKAVVSSSGALSFFSAKRATVIPGPLYHALPFSQTWQSILRGVPVFIMRRFEPELFLALVEKSRADHLFIVPTMMLRIWQLPEDTRLKYDLSGLDTVISGAAPLPAWLMQSWIDWLGAEVMNEAFGPSERIGGTFITGPEWLKYPGSVGRPASFCELKVMDVEGRQCSAGVMGEIYFLPNSGAGTTYEYRGSEPERRADGWETVGDMGYVNDEGYLFLGDRRADMILINGRNVYPAEIEGAIERFPAVRSCAVIGMPNENDEQAIYAIVDCAQESLDEETLRSYLSGQITGYKIPRRFEFVDELLRNDAGKVRRQALRQKRLNDSVG